MDEQLNWGTQNFDKTFQNINKFVTVTERQEYTKHYNNVLQYITRKLRENNDLFNEMFRRSELGGSYADKLKVSKPNEFDTDIILELPVNSSNVKITKCQRQLDLVEIKIMNRENRDLVRLMDDDGYLLQNEVFKWVMSIMDKVLLDEPYENNVYNLTIQRIHYEVQTTQSGPALTLKVVVPGHRNRDGDTIMFDMDIVASFIFTKSEWVGTKPYPNYLKKYDHPWTTVPKPDKCNEINRGFRASYRAIERDLIYNRGKMIEMIRIFKKMRDTHGKGLYKLKSYYIKTIFMLFDERLRRCGEGDFWKTNSVTKIFTVMFNILMDHLKNENLPFFWEPDYNMFEEISPSELADIKNAMNGIQRRLEKINQPDTLDKENVLYSVLLLPIQKLSYVSESMSNGEQDDYALDRKGSAHGSKSSWWFGIGAAVVIGSLMIWIRSRSQ